MVDEKLGESRLNALNRIEYAMDPAVSHPQSVSLLHSFVTSLAAFDRVMGSIA